MIGRQWLLWTVIGVATSFQYELQHSRLNRRTREVRNQHKSTKLRRRAQIKSSKSSKLYKCKSKLNTKHSHHRELISDFRTEETTKIIINDHNADPRTIKNLPYETQDTQVRYASTEPSTSVPTYIDCPSAAPSISQIPTTRPSISPTDRPSTSPSVSPTHKPSSSPTDRPSSTPSRQPSPSPSISMLPTNIPSAQPSENPSISRLPSDVPSDFPSSVPSVFPSDIPSGLPSSHPSSFPSNAPSRLLQESELFSENYMYELEILSTQWDSRISVAEKVESDMLLVVRNAVRNASRRNLASNANTVSDTKSINERRFLGSTRTDSRKLNSNSCIPNGTVSLCHTVEANYSFSRLTTTLSAHEATTLALRTINATMANMNGDDYGFVNIYFLGGTFEGTYPPLDPSRGSASFQSEHRALSNAGVSLITVASVLLILFIFVVSRKKRHHDIEVSEEIKEGILDDDSFFDKSSFQVDHRSSRFSSEDGTEQMSIASSILREKAHVVGENDSVSTFDQDGRLYGLGGSDELHIDTRESALAALNVHKCTSTTCQICNTKQQTPTFVASDGVEPEDANQRSYAVSDTVDV